MDFLFTAKQ